MAESRAMRMYYRIKRKMNERLVKAKKEGRLSEEMRAIEREGMRVWKRIFGAKPRQAVRRRRNGRKSRSG